MKPSWSRSRWQWPALLAVLACVSAQGVMAHLPAYEGERVRNDNHTTREGFAWPVRGECDINAFGPTDVNAGSANEYLGPANIPPNFFCAFTTQDDWSFEYPVDIIESSRTPAPDPRTIAQSLEEGYIPCSPMNPDPFQCSRQIPDPTQPGSVIELPGECVDLGQPSDPAASPEPDGDYHCALLPGSPRPRTSSVLFSTLTGADDVDWGVFRYDPAFAEVPIVGAPQVPACTESIRTFVTFAYAGPLGLTDARSGEPLFEPLDEVDGLPEEVLQSLPDGYGIRVKQPSGWRASRRDPRLGYASGFAQNAWLLAEDSVVECIDDFERCLADETGELSRHYNYNDIFFVNESEAIDLYLAWWVDPGEPGGGDDESSDDEGDDVPVRGKQKGYEAASGPIRLIDVSITTGVIDQFIIGDFINIGITGPFSGNGRYIHGTCRDPRTTGRVDITIENNQ